MYAQGYDFFFSHSTLASAGLCIAVKYLSGINVVKAGEIPSRLLALDLKRNSDGLALHFVGIYAPNDVKSHCDFFTNCTAFFCGDVVLGGDFNSVIESHDRLSGKLDGTSTQLQQCLQNFHKPPDVHLSSFTYHHPSISTCKSCLDRFYLNFDYPWVGYILPAPFSDHYMVGLYVPKPTDQGPRQWRFPDDLLYDENFYQQIDLILDNYNPKSPLNSWDEIKLKIQHMAQKAIHFRQSQAWSELKALKKSLKYVNKRIFGGDDLEANRILLETQIDQISDCSWFDTKDDNWLKWEGTMLPQFLHLEDNKNCFPLESLLVNGVMQMDTTLILDEIFAEIDTFLQLLSELPQVKMDMTAMTFEITEKEVEDAIGQLTSGKAPGSDGLTSYFYKHFCDKLLSVLASVFNHAFQDR